MAERLLRFPQAFSMGGIYCAPREQPNTWELLSTAQGLIVNPQNQPIHWEWIEDACGDVVLEKFEERKYRLKVSSSAASSLAALENLPADTFSVLDLSRTQIADLGLTHIGHFNTLKVVELAYTPITDAALGFVSRLDQIESLGLTATAISSDGLAHLSTMQDLKELWLNGTDIDDLGLEHLVGLSELKLLGLSGTKVTDEGILQLQGLQNLLRLYLFNTSVTEAGIARLRQQLQSVRIKWKRSSPKRPEFTLADLVDLSLDLPREELQLLDQAGDTPPMTEQDFWDVIDLLNWDEEGNDDAVIEPAIAFLSEGHPRNIVAFQEMLAQMLYQLDGEVFAAEIGKDAFVPSQQKNAIDGNQQFSQDWFFAARCCAVANGEQLYKEILADPKNMPKDLGFAALDLIAPRAYRKATGKTLTNLTQKSSATFANRKAWPHLERQ